MSVAKITIKLFGKKADFFQVIDADGEVLHVAESQDEADAWISEQ